MDFVSPDAVEAYQAIYDVTRVDLAGGYAEQRALAAALPEPGTETAEDRALVFNELRNGNLENWCNAETSTGKLARHLADRQMAPEGPGSDEYRRIAAKSSLSPLSLHHRAYP